MAERADDPRLLSLAEQISDGVPVDWSQVQDQIATPDQTAVAQELRTLERVARMNERAPATWGRFEIVGEIGRGMFGTVYRVIDPTLKLELALKVIRSRIPDIAIDQERALEEARRLVRIRHTNVVRAYGAERIGDEVGLSMELIKGRTLAEIVRQQAPFGANEAAVIGLDLCRALAAVHAAGVLHGDIKAHNVMREDGGRIVLMDFGTGRDLKLDASASGNDFAGTPIYLAPEVFAGRNRTTASDIYSLGVLLYFLVTGSHPVEGKTRTEIGRMHNQPASRRPLRDVRPDLPDAFIRVVERALAEDPDKRYQTAGALEAALAPVVQSHPVPIPDPRPDWKKLALAAVVVVGIGLGITLAYRLMSQTSPVNRESQLEPARVPETVVGASPAVAETSATPSEYSIDAAIYRERDGAMTRLQPGTPLVPGDQLSLQVQASVPAYFYVVNEDEHGESLLLFPLPGQTLTNPLSPGKRHRLPAPENGDLISWQVTTAGQREHFIILATPQRSPAFEELFASLPAPTFGRPVLNAKLSPAALGILRSVGGLTSSPLKADRQLRLMPEFSTPLKAGEERVRGVWIRQATFENSGK
jgi:serine/threonine-protein kinase